MKIDLQRMMGRPLVLIFQILLGALVLAIAILTIVKYPGRGSIYLLFSLVSNLLLFAGFRSNAIFFDTFLGIFFWLGFWLKLSVRIAFLDGGFHEPTGQFDGSGEAYDRALLVATTGMSGFIVASFIREKVLFNYPRKVEESSQQGLFNFYQNNRKLIWLGFVTLIVMVAFTNAYLGIYQRGSITRTVLPFGLNGVYKWLLLFGLASVSALIIQFEFQSRKKAVLPGMMLGLFETLVSNVSLLSRGMVLNGSALLYGAISALNRSSIRFSWRFFLVSVSVFCVFFVSSVLAVNYIRSTIYRGEITKDPTAHVNVAKRMTTPLFIDRWVGIEGVMAVSSHSALGWPLLKEALKETYTETEPSFYDNNLIQSAYANTDKTKHHFVSLPGAIAFFFYPGSLMFLFGSMLLLGILGALIEVFVFHFGGKNLILCALIAQVVAFRYASFGYVPKQSYLLFGTIFLNILIVYLADKVATRFYSK